MAKELLPCPFCGGEARTMKQHRWWVSCQECMCDLGFEGMDENGCYGHYDTEAEAIEAWNTREERTCKRVSSAIEVGEVNGHRVAIPQYRCGECNRWLSDADMYCPHCGARVEP